MNKINKATFASLANIFLKFFNKEMEKHDWMNQEKEEQLKKTEGNLPKEQSTKNEKDWKINLAIGLGITAVILLLLLVIVNISRKRKD